MNSATARREERLCSGRAVPSSAAVSELEAIPGKPAFVPAWPGEECAASWILQALGMAGKMHVLLFHLERSLWKTILQDGSC